MKIYCPKCQTCYSIDQKLLSKKGKKLRCKRCGEVWTYTLPDTEEELPQNVVAESDGENTPDNETEENTEALSEKEMNIIFSRLKDETHKLDNEVNQLPAFKKNFPKIKKLLGWDKYSTIFFEVLGLVVIICLSIFAARFEIVRRIPQAELFYDSLEIPSRVIGEGLEFQNIVRAYNNPEKPQRLSVSGFVYNATEKELDIPTVLVNVFNSDAASIQQITRQLETKKIDPKAKISFSLEIDVPLEAKYILLTFTK